MMSNAMLEGYEIVIGIETHVQLKTKTKLFCGCDNDARDKEPNTVVCPVCLGMPGTLPVLNEQAVKLAIRAGLALNHDFKVGEQTKFDRKNYFYPDLPKGYQITQFDQPIVGKGYVELLGGDKKVGITRAHLEEDAGKLTHPDGADYSLVDLNRAGTPLLEIVSEPDMRTPAEAKAYAQEVYNLMRYADVSDVDLYYGNMRFDVNVSVRKNGSKELGTRSETKNLNSFRAVEKAVEYEAKRQVELLEKGEKIIQETRGWDDAKQKTFSQRSKEEAHDYRYFPEPDVPPIVITKDMIKEAQNNIELGPHEFRRQLKDAGVSLNDAEILIANPTHAHLALKIHPTHTKRVVGWLINDLLDQEVSEEKVVALQDLSEMVHDNKLSSTSAKAVLRELVASTEPPEAIAARLNLLQVSDTGALLDMVKQAIAANPKPVEQYKAGDTKVLGYLVGQVMQASKGQANPPMVNELLKKELEK